MYRTDSEWGNALIYKTFVFRFINKNATPFYIAFVQGFELELFGLGVRDRCPNDDCLRALSDYLLVAVAISEFSRNLTTLVPLFTDHIKQRLAEHKQLETSVVVPSTELEDTQPARPTQNSSHAEQLARVEAELAKTEYKGSFDEMLEMTVQFGYVTVRAAARARAALLPRSHMEARAQRLNLITRCARAAPVRALLMATAC
jgi:hypothetical protein